METLILTKRSFGDGHIYFNLLTKDLGLISTPAFGGQRMSKRFKGALDYFQILELELEHRIKDGTPVFSISGVKEVKKKFSDITASIERYTAASYVLELASTILTPHEKRGKSGTTYFDILASSLERINTEKETAKLITEAYELSLCLYKETGFIPDIKRLSGPKNELQHLEELNSKIIGTTPKSFSMLCKMI